MCTLFISVFREISGRAGSSTLTSIQVIESTPSPVDPYTVTLLESRLIAKQYMITMKEYTGYGGTNMTLLEIVTLQCPSCWQFVYTFDM